MFPPDGVGRVERGFNVLQGGAAGMLLRNQVLSDTETDNHFLPAVHLEQPAGDALVAFLTANPGATATFPTGAPATDQGDVIAGFSSRGPGTDWIKPDVAAPGVQILAGHSPVPDDVAGGPPGNFFQAIAGTSMASPHVAGAAALLMDLHPDWTPGQVRSALALTATTDVVKTDRTTPADPFDTGSGRIQVDAAAHPNLTLDESAANFAAAGLDPLARIDLNIASINAPTMPGSITTTRTVTNVTTGPVRYRAAATSAAGSTITVSPKNVNLDPGASAELTVTISAPGIAPGQYFGQVVLEDRNGDVDLHIPVAFSPGQGAVTLTQACDPTTIGRPDGRSTCTVTAQNTSRTAATVNATTHLDSGLRVTAVSGATQTSNRDAAASATLSAVDAGHAHGGTGEPVRLRPAGRLRRHADPGGRRAGGELQRAPVPLRGPPLHPARGDVGRLHRGGRHDRRGRHPVRSHPVPEHRPGPTTCWPRSGPTSTARGRPASSSSVLTDGPSVTAGSWSSGGSTSSAPTRSGSSRPGSGSTASRTTPSPTTRPTCPPTPPACRSWWGRRTSTARPAPASPGLPTEDLRVTSTPFVPGGTLTYTVQVKGVQPGPQRVTTSVTTPLVAGTTQEVDTINVL